MDSDFSIFGIDLTPSGWMRSLAPNSHPIPYLFCNFASFLVFNLKQKMKNEFPNETLWRCDHAASERAALPTQTEMALEARLTAALANIPDVSVPSNFTARVLGAVEFEAAQAARSRAWTLNWRFLLPRTVTAAAVLIFAGIVIQRYETHLQRAALAKNVVLFAASQPLPSVEVLENLDAIQRMSQAGHADGELLAMLQ